MSWDLPEDVRMMRDLVRGFVERHLIPIEAEVPEGENLPEELLRPLQDEARKLGLWLLGVPEELGGMNLGLLERCVVQEEVARSKAIPFRNNELFGPYVDPILLEACTEDQKERYLLPCIRGEVRVCFALTEPDAGADPASLRTKADRDADGYLLNGTKRFISNGSTSDVAIVFCVTGVRENGRGSISCLLVELDSPGVSIPRNWQTMMGDTPAEIVFDDVRVPAENLIGNEGEGFKLGQQSLTAERLSGQCAWALGVAQRSYELACDYAQIRQTFGQALSERQAVQFMIADSAIELRTARLLVYDTAMKYDRGEDIRNESYMAKIYCTEASSRIVDRAIQVLGGIGLTRDLPLEYFYRQIRSLRITEGATEVLRWRLARNLLKQ